MHGVGHIPTILVHNNSLIDMFKAPLGAMGIFTKYQTNIKEYKYKISSCL